MRVRRKAADAIELALVDIRTNGLARGGMQVAGTRCLVGAVNRAVFDNPYGYAVSRNRSKRAIANAAAQALSYQLGVRYHGHGWVGRQIDLLTAKEVVDLAERTIRSLRVKHP